MTTLIDHVLAGPKGELDAERTARLEILHHL